MNVLNIETCSLTSKSNKFVSEPPYKYIFQIDTYTAVLFFIRHKESIVKTPKLCLMSL